MKIVKESFAFPSVTGLTDINVMSWVPAKSSKVKGVVQIAHGMAEHIERYDDFGLYLAENGYAVFADDHIGHGKSVIPNCELGYFGERNYAGETFIDDCKKLQDIAIQKYPNLPYIFFGHSMGSFIARKFSAKFGDTLSAAIYCGTAAKNPAAPIAIKLAELLVKIKGAHYPSKELDAMAFTGFNKMCEKRTNFDWLTRRQDIVDKYIADDKCGFLFTALGYRDLFSLLNEVSGNSWYERLPITFPILVTSGGMDPVGGYGKGVQNVIYKLRQTGHMVTEKIYMNGRHEILNEMNNEEVFEDILNWIDNAIME
ncbi:MAG: alpha/beta fold hydrolase [Oscillospiraceae bacterium]